MVGGNQRLLFLFQTLDKVILIIKCFRIDILRTHSVHNKIMLYTLYQEINLKKVMEMERLEYKVAIITGSGAYR